ncbi:MAG TPA: choice-of-anchor tandem repeat GloVer-containing protein [Candidatus Cybelea sp.]|nr:choice-of-anchor tandem repeat GloVer-containing protein [Candidatus Cybelea sp.]
MAISMLAACGGGTGVPLSPSSGATTAERMRPSITYGVLYSFKGGSGDGRYPEAGLINVNGTLYGTTIEGPNGGPGTVFSITTSGNETMLHDFPGYSGDGAFPYAGLINVNGALYGTTAGGGANHAGTVFWLKP